MDVWGKWELSRESQDRLDKICLRLDSGNSFGISKDWLSLLNYGSSPSDQNEMDVDLSVANTNVDDISNIIKDSLSSNVIISETLFVGISVNSLSRILFSINTFLDEFKFCTFCQSVASWNADILVEHSLTLVVLPKLKELTEATGCIIFSIKELATSKPIKICENVLIPLLTDNTFQFTDTELLSGVFSVLPAAQKESIILTFTKKNEFTENDWLLLHPIIKDLTQNSLIDLLECIQKFSRKFTKSLVFGRFLVNFCKTLDFIIDKDVLREVIDTHDTLLRIQALKYLELV